MSNQFVISKPTEIVDFDLLKSGRSADEVLQAATDAPTLQDIQKYNLARRGLKIEILIAFCGLTS